MSNIYSKCNPEIRYYDTDVKKKKKKNLWTFNHVQYLRIYRPTGALVREYVELKSVLMINGHFGASFSENSALKSITFLCEKNALLHFSTMFPRCTIKKNKW